MPSAKCKVKNERRLVLCTLRFALCALHFAVSSLVAEQPLERVSATGATTDLDPSWLEAAKHPQTGLLSRGVRPEDGAGYFAILNHARQLPLAELKSAANQFQKERLAAIRTDPNFRFSFQKSGADFPTFADLYRNPETYHGRLVMFRGHLRRLISSPAGDNPHGLQQLHEAWLYVEDAQQNPVVVVCTELPSGIPTGSDILVDFVSATGYFFKRYGYEDRAGQLRFAPLILAQRLEWTPRPARSGWMSKGAMFGLTLATAAAVGVGVWLASRARRKSGRGRPVHEPQSREGT